MAVEEIDEEEFEELGPARDHMITMFTREVAWYKTTESELIGTVVFDKTDKDYSYVVLAPDEKGQCRYVHGEASIEDQATAEAAILMQMSSYEKTGKFTEHLYSYVHREKVEEKTQLLFTDINEEVKKYLAKHPKALYQITPRKFEELIASIMKDMGFEVELTKATRDGGRDIIACIRNAVTSYLTYIECKQYAEDRKVGVGIIREVTGVHYLRKANKSVIVTTSFFSKDAVEESKLIENALDLKDYNDIKKWLEEYR